VPGLRPAGRKSSEPFRPPNRPALLKSRLIGPDRASDHARSGRGRQDLHGGRPRGERLQTARQRFSVSFADPGSCS